MEFLDLRYLFEGNRDLGEALLPGYGGEVRIQGRPFEVLPGGGGLEVALRVRDDASRIGGADLDVAAFEVLEEDLGVLLFVSAVSRKKAAICS